MYGIFKWRVRDFVRDFVRDLWRTWEKRDEREKKRDEREKKRDEREKNFFNFFFKYDYAHSIFTLKNLVFWIFSRARERKL